MHHVFSSGHRNNVRTGQNAQIYQDIDRALQDINYQGKKKEQESRNRAMQQRIVQRHQAINNPEDNKPGKDVKSDEANSGNSDRSAATAASETEY